MTESSDSQNVTLLDDEEDDDDNIPLASFPRGSKRHARSKNYSKIESQESVEETDVSAPCTSEKSIGKRKLRKSIKHE